MGVNQGCTVLNIDHRLSAECHALRTQALLQLLLKSERARQSKQRLEPDFGLKTSNLGQFQSQNWH
jgi:hypothetical protein